MDVVRHGIVPELQPHTKVAPVDPFSCEHALDGPLMRSLEINPYEFFKPVWLGSTCSAYVNSVFPLWTSGKKKRTAAETSAPPPPLVLVNYRMCQQNRAETFASSLHSLLVRVPRHCAPETPVATVTVGIIATPEAIIARQLRSRELRIGAAFRYGYMAQKMAHSRETIDELTDVQLQERQLLIDAHGEFGADLYATLRATAPTMLAYLVAELRAAQSVKKKKIAAAATPQRADSSADESAGACPSIDEERGLVLDFLGSDDDDDDEEEEEEDSPSGSKAVEVDGEEETALELVSEEASGKQKRAKKEPVPVDAPLPEEPEFDDYRTNELQWMRVMVQQRSFEFTMEVGFIGTFESLCARTRLLRIQTTSLPQSILDVIGDDEADSIEFLYGNALPTPATQTIGDIIAEQQDIQYGCDSLMQKEPEQLPYEELPLPAPQRIVVAAAPVAAGAAREEVKPIQRALMHQLAEIDLGAVTLLEFETYAQLRLSMLMQNWKNTLYGSGDRRWRPTRITYPELTWLSRSLMVTTCAAALQRFKYAEVLGLFVLCVAARCDDALGANLMRTEAMWYENDDDEDGKQLHLEAIRRFWRETPDVFEAAEDDVAEELTLFVAMLQRLVAAWRKFCREIEPQV